MPRRDRAGSCSSSSPWSARCGGDTVAALIEQRARAPTTCTSRSRPRSGCRRSSPTTTPSARTRRLYGSVLRALPASARGRPVGRRDDPRQPRPRAARPGPDRRRARRAARAVELAPGAAAHQRQPRGHAARGARERGRRGRVPRGARGRAGPLPRAARAQPRRAHRRAHVRALEPRARAPVARQRERALSPDERVHLAFDLFRARDRAVRRPRARVGPPRARQRARARDAPRSP